MLAEPHPRSAVELVLRGYASLINTRRASPLSLEAAVAAMAPATRSAITADLKCFLKWCGEQRPVAIAVPASPETLVHYLRWLDAGPAAGAGGGAKPATLARRLASIARVHRVLGFGETEALPTQAGMVRDTLKGIRRARSTRQAQAAPLRLGMAMNEGEVAPAGITVSALIAACGRDLPGLRDASMISLAYDAGLRVSELVAIEAEDMSRVSDGTGRLRIRRSKTDQEGEGALAWLSAETMQRIRDWLDASSTAQGVVFRRINTLSHRGKAGLAHEIRHFVGRNSLSRQGVVAILRKRALDAIDAGLVEIPPGEEVETIKAISAHSFRVGLTQDLFAAGEDGAGIALALRWSSPTTALRYARELAVGSNAAARVLARRRQSGE
ncbi:Site-specific recombinase XerD [Novosphingobium sp. B1]|nr:Site-specific recombinase XerD [Novosphingobium sp. B1]